MTQSAAPSTTEANRRLVSGMYEAATRGDFESFLSAMAPDVVVREPAFLPYGGTYHGIDGLMGLLQRVGRVLDVTGMKVDRIIADGDRVIGLIRVPLLESADEVFLAEMSIIRDGKIAELELFFHDTGGLLDM